MTQIERDRLELGARVAMCLYGENVDRMRVEWIVGRCEIAQGLSA